MKTKLVILGCGSSVGTPRIDNFWGKSNKKVKKNRRTRCSALLVKGSNIILIDSSPDIKQQLLTNKVVNISSVLITHEHADQTNGLFELRPFFWKNKKPINVYGNSHTMNLLKRRHDYLFKKTKSYPAILNSKITKSEFILGDFEEKIKFKTLSVKHGDTNSLAYIFENTAYISDSNDMSLPKCQHLQKLKYLIIDCLRLEKHFSHFNLKESLYMHKSLKPKKTILTNLHHDLDYNFLLKNLPKNVIPAYDGLKIDLN